MAVEGWEEKEICTKGAVDSQKYGEGWRWGEGEDLEYLQSYGSQL